MGFPEVSAHWMPFTTGQVAGGSVPPLPPLLLGLPATGAGAPAAPVADFPAAAGAPPAGVAPPVAAPPVVALPELPPLELPAVAVDRPLAPPVPESEPRPPFAPAAPAPLEGAPAASKGFPPL